MSSTVRGWLIVAGSSLGLLIVAVAMLPAYQLVVTAEDGQTLWTLPVRPGTPVVLMYVNSIYRAPTEEFFTLKPAGFMLTKIRSMSEAVLAYNALPAPYRREGAFLASPAHAYLPILVLRIGHTGQQRLLVGGKEIPVYDVGEGAQVTVAVRRVSITSQLARSVGLR